MVCFQSYLTISLDCSGVILCVRVLLVVAVSMYIQTRATCMYAVQRKAAARARVLIMTEQHTAYTYINRKCTAQREQLQKTASCTSVNVN
jgi:hypothetical protein